MRRSLSFLVVLFLVAGCGRNSFVGGRLDNFMAYYNTFYNAENEFDQGTKAVEVANEAINPDVYLSLFGRSDRSTQAAPFNNAIEKSADVLRKHPDSKWVDDALLLIGKSYFYLENYVGAEQKFREVMSLDSRLEAEARFWLARTLIAGGQDEAAADHLQESLNREDLSKRWEPKLRLALAELYVQGSAWDEAVAELEAGLDGLRDKALAARAQFLLAQVLETLGRYDDAVAAFEATTRYNPFYELSYAAQFNAVRVEALHGDAEDALRKLRRMERDDKNYANRAELLYLRGRVFQALNRYDEALDVYYELLYDSDANVSTVRGRTHYALGVFYRDIDEDYPLAAAYFDTAATALRQPTGGRGAAGASAGSSNARGGETPAAITDGDEQARIYGGFARALEEISRMDSLLYLGSLDEEAFEEVVLELRRQRAEVLAAQREEMEQREAEQRFQAAGEANARGQTQRTNTSLNNTAGFLFHKDPIRVQQGRDDFLQRWGERPLVPNWRRLEAVRAQAAGGGEDGALSPDDPTSLLGEALPEVDLSAVPRDSLGQVQMRADRAVARYELANVLFLSMSRPDSAAAWYRMVIEEDSDEPVAQRAYYALAEVQRALGDTLTARRLYQQILTTYPESDFVGRARERLNLPTDAPASDTLALAEDAYARAYAVWQRGEYETSLNEMLAVAAHYRDTDVAPRALLAAGTLYLEWAARDSLPLFEPLPLNLPDSLLLAGGLLQVPPEPLPAMMPPPNDTPALPPDTLVSVPDTLASVPDSLALPSDTLVVSADTLASVPADTLAAAAAVVPEPEPVGLTTLYASLMDRYPQSPQASQARRVMTALEERRAPPPAPDSTAAPNAEAVADSVVVGAEPDAVGAEPDAVGGRLRLGREGAAVDEVTTDPPVDSTATDDQRDRLRRMLDQRQEELRNRTRPSPADSTVAPPDSSGMPPPDSSAAAPVGPPPSEAAPGLDAEATPPAPDAADWEAGGWTILAALDADPAQAQSLAERLREQLAGEGYPVNVLPETLKKVQQHRVVVGLFATQEEAAAALARLAESLPEGAQLLNVLPGS